MRKSLSLGIGLSALMLINLASAQAAVSSTRQHSRAFSRVMMPPTSAATAAPRAPGVAPNSRAPNGPSHFNGTPALSPSDQISMLAVKGASAQHSEQVQMAKNIMGADKGLAAAANSIGGGGAPPSGGNSTAADKRSAATYAGLSPPRRVGHGSMSPVRSYRNSDRGQGAGAPIKP